MRRFNQAAWVLALAALAIHFLAVISYSVNVPFWDEWDVLRPGALDRELHWSWLFSFHNTHRNVPTYFSIWALDRVGGWNLNAQAALNFLVYGLLTVGALRFLERRFQVGLGALALFAASGIADESHIHPFNGCWTFYILFFFLAGALALRRDGWAWLSPLAAALSIYSMFSGWVCGAVFVLMALALARLRPELRWRHLAHAAITAVALGLWFIGYPGQNDPLLMPWEKAFWIHFGNLLALGMGYHEHNALPGVVLFALTLVLIGLAGLRALREDSGSREQWVILAGLLGGFLAAMGAISAARGWAGPGGAKSGRYAETVLFILPLTWTLLRLQLRHWCRIRAVELGAVALAGVALLAPLADEFDYTAVYAPQQARRIHGLRCLRQHFYGGGPAFCPSINPYEPQLAPMFEQRARELQLSYLREQAP
jgi:hypothetical protein